MKDDSLRTGKFKFKFKFRANLRKCIDYVEQDPSARTLNENIDFPSSIYITEESTAWLNKLKEEPGPICDRTSFAGYYSQYASPVCQSHCVLLPLVTEEVNSHAVVRHSMDRIIEIIEKINPCQVPVITGDQPVYANKYSG